MADGTFGKGCHLSLIDGSAFIFRAYHALPPLTRKSDGLPVGAVSGFVFVVASAWMQELGDADPMWNARFLGLIIYGGFGLGTTIAKEFVQQLA